ncbi:hypothetical protein [Streptomyces sp. BE147]
MGTRVAAWKAKLTALRSFHRAHGHLDPGRTRCGARPTTNWWRSDS